MKKILISLFPILIAALSVQAQNAQIPTDKEYYRKYYPPIGNFYWYLSGGPAFARGTFKNAPYPKTALLSPFEEGTEEGFGGKTGFHAELGMRGALTTRTDLRNRFYANLTLGFEGSYSPVSWSSINGAEYEFETLKSWSMFAFDIGIGVAFNINDVAVVELNYIMALPIVTSFPEIASIGVGKNPDLESFDDVDDFAIVKSRKEGTKKTYNVGGRFGMIVKTKKLLFGIEWAGYQGQQNYDYMHYNNSRGFTSTTFTGNPTWYTFRVKGGLAF